MPSEQVYSGPAAEAVLVKLALEREGIACEVVDRFIARSTPRGEVHVLSASDAQRARVIVSRYLKGALPSEAALAQPWTCSGCQEIIEGQFQVCWQCGTAKP